VLAQRAVADFPRWTRAEEGQSVPIPEKDNNQAQRCSIIYMTHPHLKIDQANPDKVQWPHVTWEREPQKSHISPASSPS